MWNRPGAPRQSVPQENRRLHLFDLLYDHYPLYGESDLPALKEDSLDSLQELKRYVDFQSKEPSHHCELKRWIQLVSSPSQRDRRMSVAVLEAWLPVHHWTPVEKMRSWWHRRMPVDAIETGSPALHRMQVDASPQVTQRMPPEAGKAHRKRLQPAW
jgi:hypothetical protein